jgi:hypothetical protein
LRTTGAQPRNECHLVLRDDRFEDLKYISRADLARAQVQPEDVPVAEPQWMDAAD